jgi:hypothetical protein
MNVDLELIALCVSILMAGLAAAIGLWNARRSRRPGDQQATEDLIRQAQAARADLAALLEQMEKVASKVEGKVDGQLQRLHDAVDHARLSIEKLQQLQTPAMDGGKRPLRLRGTLAQQVDQLAQEGLDAVEIARRAQLDVGEVELLLSLRRSRQARVEVDKT